MRLLLLSIALLLALAGAAPAQISRWQREVVYQIFPRSFRDSTGDGHGDLKGITSKLGFLDELGVTAILLNPIFVSRTYHNYFADDFFRVDPVYGTNEDFFELVREARKRDMKILLDMEVQYVADGHPWFAAVRKDPASPFAAFLWREGSAFYGLNLPWYDGAKVDIAAINPDHPEVLAYFKKVFRFWLDPRGDGSLTDGVHGFRIDHMMDDLDDKGVKTGMLGNFWTPILRDAKRLNPDTFFVGEQSDWGLGKDLFDGADVDGVFALPLWYAIKTMDRDRIRRSIEQTSAATPKGKTQFLSIENHDVDRFASITDGRPSTLRLGAVLNLTLEGTPVIYYGQELGMRGRRGDWNTDGNDIPIRLAYRWSRKVEAPGSAVWYKGTGPWWSEEFASDCDGLSLEEQQADPDSLFHFYKRLIALRASTPALHEGTLTVIDAPDPSILAYLRQAPGARPVLVVLNLGEDVALSTLDLSKAMSTEDASPHDLWTGQTGGKVATTRMPVRVEARGFRILELR
jgi:alpha-amylase